MKNELKFLSQSCFLITLFFVEKPETRTVSKQKKTFFKRACKTKLSLSPVLSLMLSSILALDRVIGPYHPPSPAL